MKFLIHTKLWKYQGSAAWCFATVGDKESKKLKSLPRSRGFGSIRVRAKLGKSTWETSVFPTKEGPYLLPVKASVRRAEGLLDGDEVSISCALL